MMLVKLWSESYKCTKTGIFCRTESVAMTLKIMCTYVHYVTLGSRCKMVNSHRVTDLEKNPVRISKDEAPTPLSIVGPLFISSLLFHLSRALLGALGRLHSPICTPWHMPILFAVVTVWRRNAIKGAIYSSSIRALNTWKYYLSPPEIDSNDKSPLWAGLA